MIEIIMSYLFNYNTNQPTYKVHNIILSLILMAFFFISCKHKGIPNQDMIDLLKTEEQDFIQPDNVFCPEASVKYCDSIIDNSSNKDEVIRAFVRKANALLQLGEEQKAIDIFEYLLKKIPLGNILQRQPILEDMAIAYLRFGERTNCINN